MEEKIYDKLCTMTEPGNILRDEPMNRHTTFRIGGTADWFVMPRTAEQVRDITQLCREQGIAYYILGNGSNLLVGDAGYRGMIIQIYKNFNSIQINDKEITVQAGALLSKVAKAACDNGLTGFEFAAGIPGTIGGAVVMNAGAYGGEMKQVLKKAVLLAPDGEICEMTAQELELSYRHSIIPEREYIVLEAVIELADGSIEQIQARMDELKAQRTQKQPLEFPSAGSTFKRPEGYFAGKLVMDAGLRGFQVGGAAVAEKHCGFVINKGDATAAHVTELIRQVGERVEAQFGVRLEPEIKMVGEFSTEES